MKQKSSPIETKSGDYLQQACLEGLSAAARQFAMVEIQNYKNLSKSDKDLPPYGWIRKMALDIQSQKK